MVKKEVDARINCALLVTHVLRVMYAHWTASSDNLHLGITDGYNYWLTLRMNLNQPSK
jgi:hypothetical protein